jgi:predicted glycosyltransferase
MPGKRLTILVCPLDWGIGHASRMIPIIHSLLQSDADVIIACKDKSGELLRTEFPLLPVFDIPSVSIHYSARKSQVFPLMLRLPAFVAGFFREHRWLKKFISMHPVDVVISDNRYGLYNRNVLSVLVTHQVSPVLPSGFRWMERWVYFFLAMLIRSFDRCWIPDAEDLDDNLTGILSHRYPLPPNALFMGILSRFNRASVHDGGSAKTYDILVILSGPEPQRTLLEEILVKQIRETGYTAAILCGLQQSPIHPAGSDESVDFYFHAPASDFCSWLTTSKIVICRSGYSSIMDLMESGRSAILIPTPGQTEQEYLAGYLGKKGWFYPVQQETFCLTDALREYHANHCHPPHTMYTDTDKYTKDVFSLYEQKQISRQQP